MSITTSSYPLVPLGKIATDIRREVELVPGIEYRSLGVQWYGVGAYVYETRQGQEFEAGRFTARAGDLIYNDMWARRGSVAVVPADLDGAVASSHFPTFTLDLDRVDPVYLSYYFRTPTFWEACEEASQGSTGRNQIKRSTFLAIRLPLPPLVEQRRVVARVEEVAAKVAEARRLRAEAVEEGKSLCRSIIFRAEEATLTPLGKLLRRREMDVEVSPEKAYHFAGVYSFGEGVFRGQIKKGSEFAYSRLTRLRKDDFVYPKLMAWEGALGIVPPECNGLVVSPEFPVFEINTDLVLPETLDTYFRTPSVWPTLSGVSTGTNVRRRRINPSEFLEYRFPLPPMEVQQRLQVVTRKVNTLRALQAETAAELDALLPSVLDRAFRGEL